MSNKIVYQPTPPIPALPTFAGQIYASPEGALYLVAKTDSNAYALICMETGNRFTAPVPYAALVPKGFTLAKGSITITPNLPQTSP